MIFHDTKYYRKGSREPGLKERKTIYYILLFCQYKVRVLILISYTLIFVSNIHQLVS